MRELDLFRQYLLRERDKHLAKAHRFAVDSTGPESYMGIAFEAKAADLIARIAGDLKELDRDAGEFAKRFLM